MYIFQDENQGEQLLSAMKASNVAHISVTFSGSGDSGSIDYVEFFNATGDKIDEDKEPDTLISAFRERVVYNHENKSWDRERTPCQIPVRELVEHLTYLALDKQGIDWYNNEGGQGECCFDIEDDKLQVTLNVSTNYTVTNDYVFRYSGT